MKQNNITKGLLVVAFVGVVAFGGLVSGIIPQNKLPTLVKPFANVLVAVDDDFLDDTCTPELCGEETIEEDTSTAPSSTTQTKPAPVAPTPVKATPAPQPVVKETPAEPAEKPAEAPVVNESKNPVEVRPAAVEEPITIKEAVELVTKQQEVQKQEAVEVLQEAQKVIQENKVFNDILGADAVADLKSQVQKVESAPLFIETPLTPAAQKEYAAQVENRIEQVANKLKESGANENEINKAVKHEVKKIAAERTRKEVQKAAAKYGVQLKNIDQDTNKNGFSDAVEVILGMNPKNADAEKKLFGVEENPAAIGTGIDWTPLTMGVQNGSQLGREFTALVSGKAGVKVQLVATDAQGNRTILGHSVISENSKTVFRGQMPPGWYALNVERESPVSLVDGSEYQTSVLGAVPTANAASNTINSSKPALVQITDDEVIETPIVKNIQNIEVEGLRDIKVTTDAEGKIKVTGSADIDAVVVGAFQSAVFTSAILADVETGSFEVNSSSPLEAGEHEVTIFSTNPRSGSQSKPAHVRFRIVPVAQAANGSDVGELTAAEAVEKNPTLLIGVSTGIGIALLVVIGLLMRKKKENGGE